jgi:hypothetical protein
MYILLTFIYKLSRPFKLRKFRYSEVHRDIHHSIYPHAIQPSQYRRTHLVYRSFWMDLWFACIAFSARVLDLFLLGLGGGDDETARCCDGLG